MSHAFELIQSKAAVIFDLYHTLTAVESSWGGNLPSTSEMLGIDRMLWNDLLVNSSPARLRGQIKDPFEIIAELARRVNPDLTDTQIERAVDNRIKRFESALIDIPKQNIAVLQTLRARGKKLGLISNADIMEKAAWSKSPLRSLFDIAIFSCDVGLVKPEPEIYQLCMEQLKVAPSQGVFVGDGGSDELAGAHRLGLTTVMMTGVIEILWPDKIASRTKDADFIIPTLTDLL